MTHSTDTLSALRSVDPEIYAAVVGEMERQENGLELIASENFVSRAVLETVGSVLTNKYAEGPAGKRYYGGCEMVDVAERLAQARACQLFGADYANVQPHSGSQANMAVMMQFLAPGDTILAMDLDAGGHLTHGSKVNFSGRLYNIVSYGVRQDTHRLDYDQIRHLAKTHRPKLIIAGASAYPRFIDFEVFGEIAREVSALLLCDIAHLAGLVAAGVHPSPVAHSDFVTTTTHKTLRGPRGGLILAKAKHAKALESSVCPRIQGGPLMHVIAAKAVAFKEAEKPDFVAYQKQIQINARALGEGLTQRGFDLVTGGTDNHLILIDLRRQQITGKLAEAALDKAGITVNKNKVPFDPAKPLITSGIRLGTPALTTRRMGAKEMGVIADLISRALTQPENDAHLGKVRREVNDLAAKFPIYRDLIDGLPSLSAQ